MGPPQSRLLSAVVQLMSRPRWSLSGRTAVVTGASKGIGRAAAWELASLGADVVAVARGQTGLAALAEAATTAGLRLETCQADITTPGGITALMDHLTAKGPLHALINNVGTNIRKAAVAYDDAEIDRIFATNLLSAFHLARRCYPLLQQAGDAAVVNVSSVAGLTALRTGVPYAMTKAALIQMTKNLAVEWAPDGIRVNAVAPWYIDTPLAQPVLQDPEALARIIARTPLGRIGTPTEVAAAIAFLCLPAAAYITGQCLAIDGGFSIFGF